jgi:serine/threonine protein kinase/tetratricopeptide (TPR) repeat protein
MIGQHFGHYEVESRLGSGGMGVVYLARDLRLDRRVAIKVLADGRVADELARTRFRREAQALSRLNHPNIATIYDFDQQDGRDFLVMEYIDGRSLRDVGPDPLPPADVVRLGGQLAEALVAAHGAGVVHLDLKPGNMMLTTDGRLKVLDFGIARLHAHEVADESTHTKVPETGTAANSAGTPPYMAPEQVAAGPVDRRTDIYAAGATLYELATGRRVFDKARGAGLYESILRDKPEPPSSHNANISAPLEHALLKALAKDPSKRQQTAEELLHDIQEASTAAPPPIARASRHWRRREVALISAAALVALAVTGYALWPAPVRARFHARDFVLMGDLDNRTEDPLLSRTVQEALSISLQQSKFVNLVSRDRVVDALRRMKRPPGAPIDEVTGRDICQREGVPALISGSVTRSGNITRIGVRVIEAGAGDLLFVGTAEYQKPEEVFARVDELARNLRENLGESTDAILKSSQPLQKVTTGSLEALRQYSRAVEARTMGEVVAVEAPLLAALQLDPDFAMAHLKLGDYYMTVAGDNVRAFPAIDRAYALRDRVTDREKHFIAAVYFSAHQQFEQARDSLKALTTLYPDDPEFRYELAVAHYALEELPPAIDELREAIRLNPHGARAHGTLVLLLARNNQPDTALAAAAEAAKAGVDSPYLLWAHGLALVGKGDLAGARSDFEKLAPTPGYTHLGHLQAARLRLFEGDLAGAIDDLGRVADMTRRENDATLELTARIQLARAALAAGDMRRARAEAAAVARLTAPSTTRPNAIRDAGTLALAVGDTVGARAYLDRLDAATPNKIVQAAHLFLAAEIARHERRFENAVMLLEDSYRHRPYYGCSRALAEAKAARGDWAAAATAWRAVLAAKGQIIQDGFPPDLELARAGLARADGHLNPKD